MTPPFRWKCKLMKFKYIKIRNCQPKNLIPHFFSTVFLLRALLFKRLFLIHLYPHSACMCFITSAISRCKTKLDLPITWFSMLRVGYWQEEIEKLYGRYHFQVKKKKCNKIRIMLNNIKNFFHIFYTGWHR